MTNGSLWLDELFIANSLIESSFGELLLPLEYGQKAPVGWLLVQKSIISLFGHSEHVLRFLALAASLASLPLTYFVAHQTLGRRWAIVPMFLVSFSPFVLWLGMQVKPYSIDLTVALGILALSIQALNDVRRSLLPLGVAGFLGIWVSMPTIFVISAVGLVLLVEALRAQERDRKRVTTLGLIGTVWAAGFAVNYFMFLRPMQEAWLYRFWSEGFFPWPVDRWTDLFWFAQVLAQAIEDPVGFYGIGIVAVLPVLAGFVFLLRDRSPARARLNIVAAPVLLTLCAAYAGRYPFANRLILFLTPSLAILFAYGLARGAESLPRAGLKCRIAAAGFLSVPICLFLLWLPRGGLPIAAATGELTRRLGEEYQPGQTVVIEHIASHAWRYYGVDGLEEVIEVPSAWNDEQRVLELAETLERLRDGPAWVVISQVRARAAASALDAIRDDLKRGDLFFGSTYAWLIAKRTPRWASLERLERGIPARWVIRREILVPGGCLWLIDNAAG